METNNIVQAFEQELNLTEQGLLELIEQKKGLIIDVNTEAGFKLARKERTEQNKIIKNIDDLAITGKKSVDKARSVLKDRVFSIYAPTVTAFEAENLRRQEVEAQKKLKEENRINTMRERINNIRKLSTDLFDKSSTELQDIIEAVDMIDVSEDFAELTQEALMVKKETLTVLSQALTSSLQSEQLELERAKLRKEREAQEEKNRINELKAKAQKQLNNLIMIPSGFFGKSANEINKEIYNLNNYEVKESEFGDLLNQANESKKQVIQQLNSILDQQLSVEKTHEEELARIRSNSQDQAETPKPTGNDALKEVIIKDEKTVEQRLAERFKDEPTVEVELPTSIDIQRFMGQIQVPVNTPEKESIINDLGYLLICDDYQLNCEAMGNLRNKFKAFIKSK